MIVSGGRGGIMVCTYIQPRVRLYKHSTSGLSSLRPGDFARHEIRLKRLSIVGNLFIPGLVAH